MTHFHSQPEKTGMKIHIAAALLPLTLLSAQASAANPEQDRKSILAMQGEYIVDFAFDETVLLKPGYERGPAMRSGGNETVIVVEDTPTKIVLQHILVDEKSGHVTKHWRQDWVYEAPSRFEFSADQTWQVRAIPADANRGAWTQCVFEVSDAPRYCGTGAWTYDNGIATWTSDQTWRPLPRREYTKRSDYNAVSAINRHTLTPGGWTHEQFNTKVLRKRTARRKNWRASSASTTTRRPRTSISSPRTNIGMRPRVTGLASVRVGMVSCPSHRACT